MKVNYYYAITSLIQFKARHHLILNKKNELVLQYLSRIELKEDFESEDVPDVTMIASATNLPRTKVHPILYQSYIDLIGSLHDKPHAITDCVHAIYIHLYDENKSSRNNSLNEEQEKRHFWGEFRLPITPRLGETITINFIDDNIKYTHGVVTEVHHHIDINSQRIIIYVHPLRNYYWMWEKLKDENNHHERWFRSLKSEQ